MASRSTEDDIEFEREFLSLWSPWLPDNAIALYAAVKYLADSGIVGDLDEQPADGEFRKTVDAFGGLDGSCYWSHHPRRAASWQERRAEQEARRKRSRFIARALRAVELKQLRTNRQAIEVMRRLGLLERTEDEEETVRWNAVLPVPLPSERIPMSAAEVEVEDRLRWRALHETLAERITKRLVSRRPPEWLTSLRAAGATLDADAEDLRQAMLLLLDARGFSVSADVERISLDEPFLLTLDRDALKQSRKDRDP